MSSARQERKSIGPSGNRETVSTLPSLSSLGIIFQFKCGGRGKKELVAMIGWGDGFEAGTPINEHLVHRLIGVSPGASDPRK